MPECLFCKIAKGELPSFTIYEDERTLAFLDINPVNPGHTLVIPKAHATNIFDISADDWAAVCETVRAIAGPIERALGASGVNLMMNNRETAGQVIDHPHVHIIPRQKGDGLHLWPQHQYADGEAASVQANILHEVQKTA
ncbi:MAG TPA: HIT family protein [Candidatus Paceibacterota bacterium]|nr:HIT family protein [Candidatus Paceibacterota bacterium]